MWRKFAVLFFVTFLTGQALAARRVTVDQLDQVLTDLVGKPDLASAQQISDLELTERLSFERLQRWRSVFPGEKSQQALTMIADRSAFLDPPASEIPSRPAPDLGEQRRMMGLTVAYVSKAIPQLPNFFATRETARYEDTPQEQTEVGLVQFQPLHRVSSASVTVLYRDGREAVDAGPAKIKKPQTAEPGLTSWGVFGPILATVLLDAAQSRLLWSHWEQETGGPMAVFEYAVPREKSHYEVNYCCVLNMDAATPDESQFREFAGYHGEIGVDPATGTILRLTLEAELKPADPVTRAALMVDYGPVEIGGRTYFCPSKSVSLSVARRLEFSPITHLPLANHLMPLKTMLNDVAFNQYHLFRGETRVLAEAEAGAPETAAKPTEAKAGTESASPIPNPGSSNAQPPSGSSAVTVAPAASNAAAGNAAGAEASAAPPPAPAPAPEISVTSAGELPEAPANLTPTAPGFTLRTTARLVDVGIVALDKKGRPVTDLKIGDFELFDNGRKQEIRYFGQAVSGTEPAQAPTHAAESAQTEKPLEFSNQRRASSAASSAAAQTTGNTTVLLIDASNLAFGDLTYAREEMQRFLKTVAADEPVGIYILKSYGFESLLEPTADHAHVAEKLANWMPTAQDLAHAQLEERSNRQQIEFVHSVYDLAYVNGNNSDLEASIAGDKPQAKAQSMPTDVQLHQMGNNPGRAALLLLAGVARHLAAIPGHKSLVWVSSDNVLADWTGEAATREDKGSQFLDPVAMRARESLNEAHVSIYPLDASQLEAGGIGADIGTRNVLPVGMSDRDPGMAKVGDAAPLMKPGRVTAQMQQDLHPIQGTYRDLAEATGGRALRRAGDIAGELDGIVADGRAAYLISFTPNTAPDDKYHVLTLRVVNRRDVSLRYRTGYLFAKEPESLKERFRRAIWEPEDSREIAIGGNLVTQAQGKALQLKIAATDLDLAQKGERWTGKLDIFLVKRDDAALHAELEGQTLGLQLKPETYQRVLRDGISFERELGSKPWSGLTRVVVVDENSGRVGSMTLPPGVIAN